MAGRNEDRVTSGPNVAAIEARIRRILVSRGSLAIAYWDGAGKRRFKKEAIEDGLSVEEAATLIAKIDTEIHGVDLGDILADLSSRHTPGVESNPEQRRVSE